MPKLFPLRRLFFLLLVGAVLTPVAGYLGALAFPDTIPVWLYSHFLIIIAGGSLKNIAALFATPATYGIKLAWPVTCVVLPLAGALLPPPNTWSPIILLVIGSVAGAATPYILAKLQVGLIDSTNVGAYIAAGAIAGAVIGMVFGIIVRGLDLVLQSKPATQARV